MDKTVADLNIEHFRSCSRSKPILSSGRRLSGYSPKKRPNWRLRWPANQVRRTSA